MGAKPITRRTFLGAAFGLGSVALGVVACGDSETAAQPPKGEFPFKLTDDQWRERLTSDQFDVLRKSDTEYPYTSPLNDEHRAGTFSCAGCDHKLFDAATKFDSGTGWPSFYEPLPNAVGERAEESFFGARTEVHCANCGGHLGHVFDDGPEPTGLRYCINGDALTFEAAQWN